MKEIPLTKGAVVIVDDADYEWLSQFNWVLLLTQDGKRYAARGAMRNGRWGSYVLMHRELLGLTTGDGKQADHKNGNGLDNRRENLRIATPQENMRNVRGTASSGIKGAYRQGSRWRAKIAVDGKQIHLGYFDTAEEAGAAYAKAAEQYFGEFHCKEHINANQYPSICHSEAA
jgi:hypothetical protein